MGNILIKDTRCLMCKKYFVCRGVKCIKCKTFFDIQLLQLLGLSSIKSTSSAPPDAPVLVVALCS